MTVETFLTRYLDETKTQLKSHYSVTSVLQVVKNELGNKQLTDLTGPDVYNYVQNRLHTGIKPNTINRELSIISAAIGNATFFL